jgi:hypothetical protein
MMVETRTAQTGRPAPLFFTLYIQNISLEGVNPPGFGHLYLEMNQLLNPKSSRSGS